MRSCRTIADASHTHTISVAADVHSILVAVPIAAINESLEGGVGKEAFAADLNKLEDSVCC